MKKQSFAALAASLALSLLAAHAIASDFVSSTQAASHVGKVATVCGKAVDIANVNGDTFINLDKPYPHHDFVFYYYGFDFPINKFKNKEVCGTGLITIHKSKPNIVIKRPSEISFKN